MDGFEKKNLRLVLLMAGSGSRFASQGQQPPKPFIEVAGLPLYKHALLSLEPLRSLGSLHAVVRQDFMTSATLRENLLGAFHPQHITVLPELSQGPAASARRVVQAFAPTDALLLVDCDLYFRCQALVDFISADLQGQRPGSGGALIGFSSSDPRYSYAVCDQNGLVRETAEKRVISTHAIAGAYYIASAAQFLQAYDKSLPIWAANGSEHYLSTLFHSLCAQGYQVPYFVADRHLSLGTPEEIERAFSSVANLKRSS